MSSPERYQWIKVPTANRCRLCRYRHKRHTFGSLLMHAGASLVYVRDQMGHSSIQVTVDIYGYLIPGANMSFVDKLDAPTSPQQSATQPQQRSKLESDGFAEVLPNEWLGGRDSNPDTQIQSPSSLPVGQENEQLSSGKKRTTPARSATEPQRKS